VPLVVFDIDDTLAPLNGPVHPDVARAVVALQDAGVTVALASGKPCVYLAGLARACLRAEATRLIGENGSEVWLDGILPARRLPGIVTDGARAGLERAQVALEGRFGGQVFLQPNAVNVTAFPFPDSGVTPAALYAFVSALDLPRVALYEHRDSLDCVPAGVDKGVALRAVMEACGVPADEVVAVGDGLNDVPMFAVAARSIAVGRRPEVRAAATDSAATIEAALALVASLLG